MNSMSESPDVELLHRAWEAMAQGDLAVLESADRAAGMAYSQTDSGQGLIGE
jgi:hypothetical protein